MARRIAAPLKQIGEAIRAGADPDGAEMAALRARSTVLGEEIEAADAELERVEAELEELMVRIPNPADPEVPVGGEEANLVVRTWGELLPHEERALNDGHEGLPVGWSWDRKPHWEIGADLGIIDNARGAKISGSGFPVSRGEGSSLQRALIMWFLDVHVSENGFTEVWPPALVNAASARGTGQIPDKEDQMYVVTPGINALELGIPVNLISEAVYARCLSALKGERLAASKILGGPRAKSAEEQKMLVIDLRNALLASKIVSYAQGFMLMRAAAREYRWNLDFGNIALLWRAGCIIRSAFLEPIKEAFARNPDLPNLLLDDYFNGIIRKCQASWRRVVVEAVRRGIPIPAISAALSFYDGYRSGSLPANLIQAQRHYFGSHTYERVDRPRGEFFHTQWAQSPVISRTASRKGPIPETGHRPARNSGRSRRP